MNTKDSVKYWVYLRGGKAIKKNVSLKQAEISKKNSKVMHFNGSKFQRSHSLGKPGSSSTKIIAQAIGLCGPFLRPAIAGIVLKVWINIYTFQMCSNKSDFGGEGE